MTSIFDEDEQFAPIRIKIENGELKTTNHLRILLEALAGKFGISTLNMLHAFRAWLLSHNLDLTTAYGEVAFIKVD